MVGRGAENETLAAMLDSISHRGQVTSGSLTCGQIKVAYCLGPSDLQEQPLVAGGTRMILDGFVVPRDSPTPGGFDSLTKDILGVSTIEDLGRHLQMVEGAFGMVLVNEEAGSIMLARDPTGYKSLHYTSMDDTFMFASEIKALLAGGIEPELDRSAVSQFLLNEFVDAPDTSFAGIKCLPAGGVLRFAAGETSLIVNDAHRVEPKEIDPSRAEEAIEEMTREAARRHAAAMHGKAAAIGVGGVDSSYMAFFMKKAYEELGAPVPQTFTVTYLPSDEGEGVTRQGDHLDVKVGPGGFAANIGTSVCRGESLSRLVYPSYILALQQVASQTGAASLFTADAVDPLFAVSWAAYFQHKAWEATHSPKGFLEMIRTLSKRPWTMVLGKREFLRTICKGILEPSLHDGLDHVLGRKLPKGIPEAVLSDEWKHILKGERRTAETEGGELRDKHGPAYQSTHGSAAHMGPSHFAVSGKVAMGAGMCHICPTIDLPLRLLAYGMPIDLKQRPFWTKMVFRRAAERILPKTLAWQDKSAFSIPWRTWFSGPLAPFVKETLLSDKALSRGYYQPERMRRYVAECFENPDMLVTLWPSIVLEIFHQVFLDGDGGPVAPDTSPQGSSNPI
jgi:asparagine synthase (glutamine-hydrolysing)